MAGWAGESGGRFGERREYEAPTLPSTPRQHGMARHHKRQPRSGSGPSKNRLVTTPASRETARHHTSQTRNGTPPHTSAEKPHRQPQNTCLVKMRMAGQTMHTVEGTRMVILFRIVDIEFTSYNLARPKQSQAGQVPVRLPRAITELETKHVLEPRSQTHRTAQRRP